MIYTSYQEFYMFYMLSVPKSAFYQKASVQVNINKKKLEKNATENCKYPLKIIHNADFMVC